MGTHGLKMLFVVWRFVWKPFHGLCALHCFRLHEHENHGLKMLSVVWLCMWKPIRGQCALHWLLECTNTKTMVWRCCSWFEEVCENISVANVHFIGWSITRTRKPWFEDVALGFTIMWKPVCALYALSVVLIRLTENSLQVTSHSESFAALEKPWFEDVNLSCCASSLLSECLVVMSHRIWISNYENQWFEDVALGLEICVKTSLWPMCTSLFFGYTNTKTMVWKCLPWFEDGLKTCLWPMCTSFVFGCTYTKTLVWRCLPWFEDRLKTCSLPMCT
jgi:hypothetical protein